MVKSRIYGGSAQPYVPSTPPAAYNQMHLPPVQRRTTKSKRHLHKHKSHKPLSSYIFHRIRFPDMTTIALVDVCTPLPTAFTSPKAASLHSTAHHPKLKIDMTAKKGWGLFNTSETIAAGRTLLVEHPALVCPSEIDVPDTADVYRQLFSRSPYEQHLLDLGNCRAGDEHYDDLAGIIATNCFPLNVSAKSADSSNGNATSATHRGIFLNASRCNHSCGPNAISTWDPVSFTLTLTAVRPIAPNEEITLQYVSPLYPSAIRHAALLSNYAFVCACELCDHHDSMGDAARALVWTEDEWEDSPTFTEWVTTTTSSPDTSSASSQYTLIAEHETQLALMDAAGLQCLPSYGRHIDMLVLFYAALGDVPKFRYWVGRLREVRGGERAVEKDIAFATWLSNPRSCGVWGIKCLEDS